MIIENHISLNNKHEYIGMWYHPSNLDKQVPGILTYDPNGQTTLMLEADLDCDNYDVLNGVAGGKHITLLDCFKAINRENWLTGYCQIRVTAHYAIVGVNLKSTEDLHFSKIEVMTTKITPWSCMTGLYDNANHLASRLEPYTISFKKPDPVVFFNDQNTKITLKYAHTTIRLTSENNHHGFTELNYFEIRNKGKISGLFFDKHLDSLRKFISFSCRFAIETKVIRAYLEEDHSPVYVLYHQIPLDFDFGSRDLDSKDMFYALPEVESNILEVYTNWFEAYNKYPEPFGRYFYKTNTFQFDKFLPIAQALEDFHLKKYKKSDWGYKSRIKFLFNRYSAIMSYTGNVDVFAQMMQDHRDYFSHWFEKKKHKVTKGLELEYLTRDACLLLELCLLEEIGFDLEKIKTVIERNIHYSWYLGLPIAGTTKQRTRHYMWEEDET